VVTAGWAVGVAAMTGATTGVTLPGTTATATGCGGVVTAGLTVGVGVAEEGAVGVAAAIVGAHTGTTGLLEGRAETDCDGLDACAAGEAVTAGLATPGSSGENAGTARLDVETGMVAIACDWAGCATAGLAAAVLAGFSGAAAGVGCLLIAGSVTAVGAGSDKADVLVLRTVEPLTAPADNARPAAATLTVVVGGVAVAETLLLCAATLISIGACSDTAMAGAAVRIGMAVVVVPGASLLGVTMVTGMRTGWACTLAVTALDVRRTGAAGAAAGLAVGVLRGFLGLVAMAISLSEVCE